MGYTYVLLLNPKAERLWRGALINELLLFTESNVGCAAWDSNFSNSFIMLYLPMPLLAGSGGNYFKGLSLCSLTDGGLFSS